MQLNDPELVAREYADETRLAARRRAWREFLEGPDADDRAFEAVAERRPRRVLEVGCGWGEMAERIDRETEAGVIAFDRSLRMTELARGRDVRAFVADAQAIPVPDRSFDLVLANAVLYHVPDLDRALSEIARVMTDDGGLVATTFDAGRFAELWSLVGADRPPDLPFSMANGAEILGRRFARIDRRSATHALVFPGAREVRTYLASTITLAHLADRVPEIDGPFRAERTFAVFVAEGPKRS